MTYRPKPGSQAQLLVNAIIAAGTIRTPDLQKATGIPPENHTANLDTAIIHGLVIVRKVPDKNREVREYQAGPNARVITPPALNTPAIVSAAPLPRPAKPPKPATAKPTPQPAVGNNTGSAPLIVLPPEMIPVEGRAVEPTPPTPSAHSAAAPVGDVTPQIQAARFAMHDDGRLAIAALGIVLTAEETKALGIFMYATRPAWHPPTDKYYLV